MKSVFRLRDLATKSIDMKAVGRTGSVGLVGPDGDIDDFPTPITPYISIAKYRAKLDYIDHFKGRIEELDLNILDQTALDVGRAVVGAKFVGTALCSADMPTCARNARISPVASFGESLTNIDLAVLRSELEQVIKHIDGMEY